MKKTFWDRTAKIYDRFMKKDHTAYELMYALIDPVVRHRQVLELATGTGLIDTTDGLFMSKKEAKRLMLQGSTLLVGRK